MSIKKLSEMIEHHSVINKFSKIANYLLNEVTVEILGSEIILCEIEFYYLSQNHLDIDIHCDCKQLESNTFYVHSKGRGGIDITFGNGQDFGGILIRGIKVVDIDKYINGPLSVYKYFLSKLNVTTRNELREKINQNVFLTESTRTQKMMYRAPRVGLVNECNNFSIYPYRYVINIIDHMNSNSVVKEKCNIYLYSLHFFTEHKEKIISDIGYGFDVENYKKNLGESSKLRDIKIIDFLKNNKLTVCD